MVVHGKSLYDKAVCVSFRHNKFKMILKFDSDTEAEDFYSSFDYRNEKLRRERLSMFFCNHKNTSELDVGSKAYHYIHCIRCNMATFVDDETEEDKILRRANNDLIFKKFDIDNLKEDIDDLTQSLSDKRERLYKLERENEQ